MNQLNNNNKKKKPMVLYKEMISYLSMEKIQNSSYKIFNLVHLLHADLKIP